MGTLNARPPGPRIRDLSHVARSLEELAGEVERRPLTSAEQQSLLVSLKDHARTLQAAQTSAEERAMSPGPDQFESAQAQSALRAASGALGLALATASSVPWNGALLFERHIHGPQLVDLLHRAAEAAARAEAGAAAASGPEREQLERGETETVGLGAEAVAEAAEQPRLRRALETSRVRSLQAVLKAVAPAVARLALGRVRFRGEPLPLDSPFILALTHGHEQLELPVLLPTLGTQTDLPLRTMLKFSGGVVGHAQERLIDAGVIPVQIGGGRGTAALAVQAELIRRGQVAVIYPEGRVTQDDTVGTLHDGVARLALATQVPIYPVAIYGSKHSSIEGPNGRRGIVMHVGKPIWPESAPATQRNVEIIRDRVQVALLDAWDKARDEFQTGT